MKMYLRSHSNQIQLNNAPFSCVFKRDFSSFYFIKFPSFLLLLYELILRPLTDV